MKLAMGLLLLVSSISTGQTLLWEKESEWVKAIDNPSILVQDLSIPSAQSSEYLPIRIGKEVEIVEIRTGQVKKVFEELPQTTNDSISNYYTFSKSHVDTSGNWFYLHNTINSGNVPSLETLHFSLKRESGEIVFSGRGEASFLYDGSSSMLMVRSYDSIFVYKFWGSATTKVTPYSRLSSALNSGNPLSRMYSVSGRMINDFGRYKENGKVFLGPHR